jgi:hypothetical protein
VNPGLYEDAGADLLLGSAIYAYVPGRFRGRPPIGRIEAEVVAGFERSPRRLSIDVDGTTSELSVPLERSVEPTGSGWAHRGPARSLPRPVDGLAAGRPPRTSNLVHLLATHGATSSRT